MFNLFPRILFGLSTRDAGSIKLGAPEVFTADVISRSPFAEAERIQPKSAEVQNNFANALAAAGRTDEALQHYQTAIALDPDLAQAYFNYGWTLAEKGSMLIWKALS